MAYIGNAPYQGSVASINIVDGTIDTPDLKDGSVTSSKLETVAGLTSGSYGTASAIPAITVDTKGRITSISTNAVSIPSGSISVTGGDITMSGNTGSSITNATLANSGATAGTYGSSSAVPQITVDAKGRITSVSSVNISSLGDTVISSSGTSAALRITQTGTGNALLVEDSANPDATPFVVDKDGNVIQGATSFTLNGTVAPWFAIVGNNAFGPQIVLENKVSDSSGSYVVFRKNRDSAIVNSGDTLGVLAYQGFDGTNSINAANISAQVDGTPGTNDMPGRLIFRTTADGGSGPTERMRIDSSGLVGIGGSSYAGVTLRAVRSITGSTFSTGILSDGTVQSDVTDGVYYFQSATTTAASAFTTTTIAGFLARQNTIGAGSTVTGQYGFFADSTLTGATSNYGFFSNIVSGTGRWNFYANGTARNYFAGNTGIGGDSGTTIKFFAGGNATGSANQVGIRSNEAIQSDVTGSYQGIDSLLTTQAASFTISSYNSYRAGLASLGASSALTTVTGYVALSNLAIGTNNYGFRGQFALAANTYNLYMDGTAANYLAGKLGINADPIANTSRLIIGGTVTEGAYSSGFGFVGTFGNGVTNRADSFVSFPSVNNTTGTTPALNHFYASQNTFSTAVTNQYGYYVASSLTGATNDYGFYSDIASGTGRWNFYANGTAQNYFAGTTLIGTTTNTNTSTLVVNGTISQTVSGTQYLVVDQSDIGTAPNEIPLNQYLGSLAYQDASNISVVTWQTVQTAAFTAIAGMAYPCNTTSAAFTVTLPSSPAAGNVITLLDYAGTWATNNLTINPNGNKINGGTNNVSLGVARASAQLVYIDSTQGWIVYSGWAATSLGGATILADFALVAGGGGGGGGSAGGGGGGGGFRTKTSFSFTSGQTYTITVGSPGAAGVGAAGGNGGDSSIAGFGITADPATAGTNTFKAYGGGGGGAGGGTNSPGSSGGSGGGGGSASVSSNGGLGNQPNTTPSQGNTGGNGAAGAPYYSAGGGGGAFGNGGSASGGTGGNGANGLSVAANLGGSTYAGGGGAGGRSDTNATRGLGGTGGGGDGGANSGAVGSNGGTNTGGGGGGGSSTTSSMNGGAGGSGIVIIAYPDTYPAATTTGSPTYTVSGGYRRYTFTGNGTIIF